MAEKAILQVSKRPVMARALRLLPDKWFIYLKWYGRRMPYHLNLNTPKTYNEKLQWIKLYDHNPLYTKLVDKYQVKNYVTNAIGGGILYR